MIYLHEPSPFAHWKATVLGRPYASDAEDMDGDQISILQEYAFAMDPAVPEASVAGASTRGYTDGVRLRMMVPRDGSRTDVNIDVQVASSLLGPWMTIASSVEGRPFAGPGYYGGDSAGAGVRMVEIRDPELMGAFTQRFLRARVSR